MLREIPPCAQAESINDGGIGARRLMSWMLFAAANTPDTAFVHLTWIRQLPLLLTHLTEMLDKDKSVEEFYRGLACIKALLILMNRHYRAYARASKALDFLALGHALTLCTRGEPRCWGAQRGGPDRLVGPYHQRAAPVELGVAATGRAFHPAPWPRT